MYREWHGPVVGMTAALVWEGYAARLFFEFGQLNATGRVRRDGTPGRPTGEFTLTNMDGWCGWSLLRFGKEISTSEMKWRLRKRWLPRLAGRRLVRLQIDAASRCTKLTFSRGWTLTTWSYRPHREPHWMIRSRSFGSKWDRVALPGTTVVSDLLR
jgi:hypothetical protein